MAKPTSAPAHIKDLVPDPRNARKHGPRNVGTITDALREVGFARSIVIDEQNIVLAGNATIEAAAEAGMTKVQVVDADGSTVVAVRRAGLTPQQKARLALYDNRAAELADGWDADVLRALQDDGVSLAGLWGDDELRDLFGEAGPVEGLTDPDAVPEERATDIQPGDLFALGDHRLLCGDSTKAADVARVLDGERVALCFTSPPYGAGKTAKLRDHYVPGTEDRKSFYVSHQDDPGEWLSLMAGWFSAVRPSVDAVVCNVQMLADNKLALVEWLYAYRNDLCDVLVWDKAHGAPQMQERVLSNAYEFLVVFGGNGTRAIQFSDFHGTISNVVRINPHGKNEFANTHAAVMPVQLPVWALRDLCPKADSVLEPFSGSGTTIIACEQLRRRCYAIEIEPRYVQVAIDRWEAFTGRKAQKLGELTKAG